MCVSHAYSCISRFAYVYLNDKRLKMLQNFIVPVIDRICTPWIRLFLSCLQFPLWVFIHYSTHSRAPIVTFIKLGWVTADILIVQHRFLFFTDLHPYINIRLGDNFHNCAVSLPYRKLLHYVTRAYILLKTSLVNSRSIPFYSHGP